MISFCRTLVLILLFSFFTQPISAAPKCSSVIGRASAKIQSFYKSKPTKKVMSYLIANRPHIEQKKELFLRSLLSIGATPIGVLKVFWPTLTYAIGGELIFGQMLPEHYDLWRDYIIYITAPLYVYSIKRNIRSRGYATTSRSLFNYLLFFRLFDYDFTNKVVVDLGAGHSTFTKNINLTFQGSNTLAIALDINHESLQSNSPSLVGDMNHLPIQESSVDLFLSNYAFVYLMYEKGEFVALNEFIRATASGGSIKLRVPRPIRNSSRSLRHYERFLNSHPAVAGYRVIDEWPDPMTKIIEIDIRSDKLSFDKYGNYGTTFEKTINYDNVNFSTFSGLE